MVAVLGETCWRMFGSVRRSADLTEYYRRDIVSDHIGADRAHLSRGSCLCSARSLARSPDGRGVFSETPKQFHFTLSSTTNPWTLNQVIVCLGCLTCLIVVLYLFDFHWRVVGRFMSNAEYAMLLVYVSDGKNGFLKVMHTEILCFCLFFFCRVMCYDHSSAASRFTMITSIPKKQVLVEG